MILNNRKRLYEQSETGDSRGMHGDESVLQGVTWAYSGIHTLWHTGVHSRYRRCEQGLTGGAQGMVGKTQ